MTYTGRILLLLLLIFCSVRTFAQTEDCEVTINRAQEEFNAGHFYLIPNILSPCLNQFSADQKQRAYLLLTQTYLLLDDPIGSKDSYLSLLKANPEFVTDTAVHPIDVIYLSKRFTATSIFSWFVKAGTNTSIVRVIQEQSTLGESGAKDVYNQRFGYQGYVGADLALMGKFNARAELGYAAQTYKRTTSNYFQFDTKEFIDRQGWISLPLSIMYSDNSGKYRPYAYIGYAPQYLVSDRALITITNNRPSTTSSETVAPGTEDRENTSEESPTLNLLYKRNRWNQSIILGGGVKAKIGLDFIFVDLRYSVGLKNVVAARNSFANYSGNGLEYYYSGQYIESLDPTLRYLHVDDYFRLDNLSISFGFLRPLYKPRELKYVRTKSVMKKIRKK